MYSFRHENKARIDIASKAVLNMFLITFLLIMMTLLNIICVRNLSCCGWNRKLNCCGFRMRWYCGLSKTSR